MLEVNKGFLPRIVLEVERVPVIAYVEPWFLQGCPREKLALQEYVHQKLHTLPASAWENADHLLVFAWGLAEAPAVTHLDVWLQEKDSESAYGFLTKSINTYANGVLANHLGVASGVTRIVSGLEEQYRLTVMDGGGTFQDYLYSQGPLLPPSLQVEWE